MVKMKRGVAKEGCLVSFHARFTFSERGHYESRPGTVEDLCLARLVGDFTNTLGGSRYLDQTT